MNSYKTIYKENEYITIEKRSKFIGTALPAESKADAEEKIKALQKKYADATHNVFAYRVIEGGQVPERQSDDGEPSGTAGMPVLEVLRGEELYNVVVVVTRYYGGTLLGTGGLTRAYGHTAKAALGQIIKKEPYRLYSVIVGYSQMGQIQYEIINNGHILQDTIYLETVQFMVYTREEQGEGFEKRICDITHGVTIPSVVRKLWGFYHEGVFFEG